MASWSNWLALQTFTLAVTGSNPVEVTWGLR